MAQTSIHLDTDTRDRLRALKEGNETYDDLLNRLLEGGDE